MSTALADGVVKHCEEAGISVPEACSLVVSSGVDNHVHASHYTRMAEPFEKIGRTLLEMLLRKIDRRGEPQPGIYIRGIFLHGESTLPEENAFLIGKA